MTPTGSVQRPAAVPAATQSGAAASHERAATTLLPAPSMSQDVATGDAMTVLYALTAQQRDASSDQRARSAEKKGEQRQEAFVQMREELAAAKAAQDDGGWLSSVTDLLDSVSDAVVGGNPLQDLAHALSEATGCDAFDIAYDFLRPDALLNGAAMLASEASGRVELAQVYDLKPWETPKSPSAGLTGDGAGSSLKTRFQAAADLSGHPGVMETYEVTRGVVTSAMVTVGTLGTGTVAMVAIASSAALMLEARADLLGELGVKDNAKTWVRVGAQVALLGGTAGLSYATGSGFTAEGANAAVAVFTGADQASRGAVDIGKNLYQDEVNDHQTEAAVHETSQRRLDRESDRLIAGLRDLTQSYQRTLATLSGTIAERDQTTLIIARQLA